MKAAVLHGFDQKLRLETVPSPDLMSDADVIVRISGAGLCRTDLHIIEGVWKNKVDTSLPYILGHENAGWIEDVGKSVKSVKPGDAVIVHPVITCGLCLACRPGQDMHCTDLQLPGITQNGGFAEYLLTGERACIKLPEGLAPRAIARTPTRVSPPTASPRDRARINCFVGWRAKTESEATGEHLCCWWYQ